MTIRDACPRAASGAFVIRRVTPNGHVTYMEALNLWPASPDQATLFRNRGAAVIMAREAQRIVGTEYEQFEAVVLEDVTDVG